MSKLSLDRDQIDLCRNTAEHIIKPILHYVNRHTTVSIERSVLRLLGVEGALEENSGAVAAQGLYPLVNEVIQKLGAARLTKGAGYWFGLASVSHPRLTPSTLARKIVSGEIDLAKLETAPLEKIDEACHAMLAKTIAKLRAAGERRKRRPIWPLSSVPLRYVIVATGNIHEDIRQAQAAAEMGADIIAVIRSTAQSLLDYVPEGATTEGFGGTFATQENFRLMRQALDQSEKQLKRRVGLTNYSSGLCMPEIAVLGGLEGIDYLLNDAMYGILFRDINMRRNFVDQYFSRRICALSGITIQTGEDNYLTTAESHKYWYQVLASHFINEAFAKSAGLLDSQIALGHAHEIDPWIEDSILYEWAQAQLVREVFPRCPIKFMPPTKHKTGDIFFSYLYDGLFNLAGILTGQTIQLLGMHTEAIHNPFVQDRYLSLKNASYIFRGAKSIKDEVVFQSNGKIARRARQVLDDALSLLKKVRLRGLMRSIEDGAFANVRRGIDGGKGTDGVFEKDRDYYTPLKDYLTPKQQMVAEEERSYMRAREGGRDRGRGRAPGRDHGRGGEQVREQDRGRDQGRDRGRGRDLDRGRRGGRGGDRGRRPDVPQRPQGPAMKTSQVPEAAGSLPSAARELAAEAVSAETVIYLPPPGGEAAPNKAAPDAPGEASNREGPSETARGESGFDPRRQRPGRGRRRGRRGGRGRSRGRGGPSGPGGSMEEAAAFPSDTGEGASSNHSTLAGGRDDEAPQRPPRDTSDSSEGNE